MNRYKILYLNSFTRDYKKIKRNSNIVSKIEKVLSTLKSNPFDISLKTHQVTTHSLGTVWSSRVTGDLRLIWTFDEEENLVIVAIRLQSHDTVYN